MLKKAMDSEGMIVVGSSSLKNQFLKGFSWSLGSTVYTVIKVITKDANTEMRRVKTSEGEVEEMEVTTILRDLKEKDCKVLDQGDSPEGTVPEVKKSVKKTAKKKIKKTAKKKIKKAVKKKVKKSGKTKSKK
jgi:hypothetical protein